MIMRKILLLSFLFIGFYSCNKEIDRGNVPPPNLNDQLITHEGISISESEASKVANLFFKTKFNSKTKTENLAKTIKSVGTISDDNGNALMYVVNFEPTGFTIISATKNYAPILAYSDDSQFNSTHSLNQGVTDWLDETKYAIELSDNLPFEEKFKNRIQWINYEESVNISEVSTRAGSASEAFSARVTQLRELNPGYNFYPLARVSESMFPLSNTYGDLCNLADGYNSPREYTIVGIKSTYTSDIIGPLLTTKWSQKGDFNNHLPGDNYSVGCVTIAVAQIINFHKFPNNYNWKNIPNDYATDETRRLLGDVGRALNINYKPGENSATDGEAKRALEDFGYNATLSNHNFASAENEIKRYRRPVYMSGMDRLMFPSIGHAWVCDGTNTKKTKTSYLIEFIYGGPGYYNFSDYGHYPSESSLEYLDFHMNWGWGGASDGWYIHSSSKPTNHIYDYDRLRNDIFVSKK